MRLWRQILTSRSEIAIHLNLGRALPALSAVECAPRVRATPKAFASRELFAQSDKCQILVKRWFRRGAKSPSRTGFAREGACAPRQKKFAATIDWRAAPILRAQEK